MVINENENIQSTRGTNALSVFLFDQQQSTIVTIRMKKRPNQPIAERELKLLLGCIFLVMSLSTLERFQNRIASNQIERLNDISLKNFKVIYQRL